MNKRKAQTIFEYTVILVIVLGVMITMKDYIKRGIQGRWKSATDDFGAQYDPQHVNSIANYTTIINSESIISATNGETDIGGTSEPGQWTNRLDQSNSLETKTGFTQVGY